MPIEKGTREKEAVERAEYEKPVLVRQGELKDITAGGTGSPI
jgi:hypothetical protein